MPDDNKRNLQYFEAPTMRELYDMLDAWQQENSKRFLSLNIEKGEGAFSCIALTNPSEVIIVDGGKWGAGVSHNKLWVGMG